MYILSNLFVFCTCITNNGTALTSKYTKQNSVKHFTTKTIGSCLACSIRVPILTPILQVNFFSCLCSSYVLLFLYIVIEVHAHIFFPLTQFEPKRIVRSHNISISALEIRHIYSMMFHAIFLIFDFERSTHFSRFFILKKILLLLLTNVNV